MELHDITDTGKRAPYSPTGTRTADGRALDVNLLTVCETAAEADVAVAAAGETELVTIATTGMANLFVQFTVATQALDGFTIKAQAHPDAPLATLFSAGGDYTSPAGLMIDASGNLTTTAAAASGWFLMDVRGLDSVTITASAAVDSAVVDIWARACR